MTRVLKTPRQTPGLDGRYGLLTLNLKRLCLGPLDLCNTKRKRDFFVGAQNRARPEQARPKSNLRAHAGKPPEEAIMAEIFRPGFVSLSADISQANPTTETSLSGQASLCRPSA